MPLEGNGKISFERKYVVAPDNYDDFRFGGETVRNLTEEISTMLEYFSKYYTEEQLMENMKKYNLESSNYLVDLLYEALIYESNNSG